MKDRFVRYLLFFISILLFVSLIKSWLHFQKRTQVLKNAENKLYAQKEEQQKLERELAKVESRQFVEKQARDKLNMTREGEIMIIIPSPVIIEEPTPTPVDNSSNWQKWMGVFW